MSRRNVVVCTSWLVWFVAMGPPGEARANDTCMECHGEPSEKAKDGTSIFVDAKALKASIHGENETGCTDCHSDLDGVEDFPHADELAPVSCGDCHDEAAASWGKGVHARHPHSANNGKKPAASCADCHGKHDIRPKTHVDSRTNHFNVAKTCARCHGDVDRMREGGLPNGAVAKSYQDSIHGRGVREAGLVVAPDCATCHGAHDIMEHTDASSRLHPANVAKTCGECHLGVKRRYEESVHAKAFAEGKDAPTCESCHSAHRIAHTEAEQTRLGVLEECGHCHAESFRTYRDTFHGQVTALGYARVATCADCHGAHDVQPKDDPRSRVSEERVLETCQSCHPSAAENFVGYDPHADPHDPDRDAFLYFVYMFMEWLLIVVFGFFGFHTILWFVRSLIEHRKHKRERPDNGGGNGDKKYVRRFDRFARGLHFFMMTSFLGLAATGLPLRFAGEEWASWIAHRLGGFGVMGSLHRIFAILMVGAFAAHIVNIAWRFIVKREKGLFWGPRSLVPQPQDARDIFAHMRWFLGRGPRPKFDRYTYWEKFDYWAVFWGMAIIGGSGLVLWFPEFFTSFLPGEVINVAMVIHGEEALLAVGFIFTIHFFNSHLRPEKFPMDLVIFTGAVSMEEMDEERPLEVERLKAAGSLEEMATPAPDATAVRLGRTIGTAAVLTGVVLIVLILISALA